MVFSPSPRREGGRGERSGESTPTPPQSGEGGSEPKAVEGDRLLNLMDILDKLEASLIVLERRGVTLPAFITHAKEGVLPTWHVKVGRQRSAGSTRRRK